LTIFLARLSKEQTAFLAISAEYGLVCSSITLYPSMLVPAHLPIVPQENDNAKNACRFYLGDTRYKFLPLRNRMMQRTLMPFLAKIYNSHISHLFYEQNGRRFFSRSIEQVMLEKQCPLDTENIGHKPIVARA
jgi:hypothetical protein